MSTEKPKGRLLVGAVLAGAVLLGGGFALGTLTSGDGDSSIGGACSALTLSGNGVEIERLLADGSGPVAASEKLREGPGTHIGLCEVESGGDQALLMTVELKRFDDYKTWQQHVTDNELVATEGRRKLDVAGGGLSTASDAGVYVPCDVARREGGKPERAALSVLVSTDLEGDHRKDLETLVRRAADEASSASVCAGS